jgi:glycosyltransferase involved in cell wall biosynthesis
MNDICLVQNSIKTTYIFRKEYIERFIAEGRNVFVIAPGDCKVSAQALNELGCTVVETPQFKMGIGALWSIWIFNWTIAKFRLTHKKTTYLCFFLTTFIFSLPTLTPFNKRLLLSVEGLGSFFTKRKLAKFILRGLIKHLAEIRVFCNEDERRQIGQKSDTVTNGIGINLNRFQTKLRTTSKPFTLVYVGRLIEDKGIRDAIEILDRSLSLRLDVKLKVVGDYYPNNPTSLTHKDVNEIKNRFGERIEFLGFVQNIEEVYSDSDILLLPSVREGFPVCVMEASAMGVPTLTYDVPGCRDAVTNGKNGYITKFKDINGLVSYIKELHDNSQLLSELEESSKRYAIEKFDVSLKINQLNGLIKEMEHQAQL